MQTTRSSIKLLLFFLLAHVTTSCNLYSTWEAQVQISRISEQAAGRAVHATQQHLFVSQQAILNITTAEIILQFFARSNGQLLWQHVLHGSSTGVVRSVQVSAQGDAYVAGNMNGFLVLDGEVIWEKNVVQGFVLSFTITGAARWRLFGTSESYDNFQALALDTFQNLIVASYFFGKMKLGAHEFDGGKNGALLVTRVSAVDGTVMWGKIVDCPSKLGIMQILIDEGLAYVTGFVTGNTTFADKFVQPQSYARTSAFLAKFEVFSGEIKDAALVGSGLIGDGYRSSYPVQMTILNHSPVILASAEHLFGEQPLPERLALQTSKSLIFLQNIQSAAIDKSILLMYSNAPQVQIGNQVIVKKYSNSFLVGFLEQDSTIQNIQEFDATMRIPAIFGMSCVGNACYFVADLLVLGNITHSCVSCPTNSVVQQNRCITCPIGFSLFQEKCVKQNTASIVNAPIWQFIAMVVVILWMQI